MHGDDSFLRHLIIVIVFWTIGHPLALARLGRL